MSRPKSSESNDLIAAVLDGRFSPLDWAARAMVNVIENGVTGEEYPVWVAGLVLIAPLLIELAYMGLKLLDFFECKRLRTFRLYSLLGIVAFQSSFVAFVVFLWHRNFFFSAYIECVKRAS